MRLRILGCHGGESPTHRPTSFLIDDTILLDAGGVVRGLPLEDQARIDHIVISHSHLDHAKDLALLADNVITLRNRPVTIYCTDGTASALEKHFFNNIMWPDFTKIPYPSAPDQKIVRIERVQAGVDFAIGAYSARLTPVNHPVECHAMLVRSKAGTLAYSADTGPTEALWRELNALTDLRALIIEVSFPNALEKIAHVSGHFTPAMLATELTKWQPQNHAQVLLYGMKPAHTEVLREEIAALADPRLRILRPMDEFDW